MRFDKYLTVTFSVGLPAKMNNHVPASPVRFQHFRVIERFRVVSSNKRSDRVRHSSNDLAFLLTVLLERQYRHFRIFANRLNAFRFFPRNSGRGTSRIS